MRRISILLSVVAVLILGGFAAGRLTSAQEASPVAGDQSFEGLTFELLGAGTIDALPPAPADFILVRITLDPRGELPVDPADPSLALVRVEAGTLTLTLDMPLEVLRASFLETFQGDGPLEMEAVAAGTEATLSAGDSFIGLPNVSGDVRNNGTEPVVLVLASINPIAQMATPVS